MNILVLIEVLEEVKVPEKVLTKLQQGAGHCACVRWDRIASCCFIAGYTR